jgi:hypothetical protein
MTSLSTQPSPFTNIPEEEKDFFIKYGRMRKTAPSRKRPKYFDSAEREIEKARRNKSDLKPIKEQTEPSPRSSTISV